MADVIVRYAVVDDSGSFSGGGLYSTLQAALNRTAELNATRDQATAYRVVQTLAIESYTP